MHGFVQQGSGGLDGLLGFSPGIDAMQVTVTLMFWAGIVVNCVFAVAVLAHSRGRRTALVKRAGWVLATAVTGVVGALCYWVVNVMGSGSDPKNPR